MDGKKGDGEGWLYSDGLTFGFEATVGFAF